jgi:hypothetical protein
MRQYDGSVVIFEASSLLHARIPALQLPVKNHITIDRLRNIETVGRNRLHDLAPPNHRCPNSTHLDCTLAPVEEPSTARQQPRRLNATIASCDQEKRNGTAHRSLSRCRYPRKEQSDG